MKKLVVITGPSCSGKSTLQAALGYTSVVSHTTREPRPGELNGVDYHFISGEAFVKEVREGGFVETTEYLGEYYGTHSAYLTRSLMGDKPVAIVADLDGLFQLADYVQNKDDVHLYAVLTCVGKQELYRRLLTRLLEEPDNTSSLLERYVNRLVSLDHEITWSSKATRKLSGNHKVSLLHVNTSNSIEEATSFVSSIVGEENAGVWGRRVVYSHTASGLGIVLKPHGYSI